MNNKSLTAIIILLMVAINTFGQYYSSKDERAIRYFERGQMLFNQKEFLNAREFFDKAIEQDPKFSEALLFRVGTFFELGEEEQGLIEYKKAIEANPYFKPNAYLDLAWRQFNAGKYKDALESVNSFYSLGKGSDADKKKAEDIKKRAEFALKLYENPVPFKPENLSPTINSKFSEYWPVISLDESTLTITVRKPVNDLNSFLKEQEDLYISKKNQNGEWSKVEIIPYPINTNNNEGNQTLLGNGDAMFYTSCNKDDGEGMCDIYYTQKENGSWTKPINLGKPINTQYSEKHPSTSPDGRVLFFASNRPGGYGKLDIWMAEYNGSSWSEPKNLGEEINTSGNDWTPFIHADGKTLYFSSEGHLGMGGYDLFVCRKDENGNWGKPQNLGYPINTNKNEQGLCVSASGSKGYYASMRDEGYGLNDIYVFDIPQDKRPTPVSYMKGNVYNNFNFKPLVAEFELTDLESGEIIAKSNSETDGKFIIPIPTNRNYALNVSKKGFLFYSDHFELKGNHSIDKPFIKDIPLKPIQKGETIILKNIFYSTDSYELRDESKTELNKVIELLNLNPGLRLEIGGHTDNRGTEEYNQQLSENRAKSVYNYLVNHGIESIRLEYKGYGELSPISTNETPEGRAMNRRTELKVL